MNLGTPTTETVDTRVLLSALWVFAMLNYLYADVMSLMDPILLPQYVRGEVEGLRLTRPFLLGAAVMMEVPIAMTLLARVLPHRANRRANLFAAVFKTVAVAGSLLVGTPNAHYLFFAVIEIACTVVVFSVAWQWRAPAGAVAEAHADGGS